MTAVGCPRLRLQLEWIAAAGSLAYGLVPAVGSVGIANAFKRIHTVLGVLAVCMSLCLHRYAAHAAFQCEGATHLACGILGCLAFQGGLMREPPACPTPQLQLLASSSGGELTVRGPALVGGKAPLAPQVLRRRLARPALSRSDRRREVRPPPPTPPAL